MAKESPSSSTCNHHNVLSDEDDYIDIEVISSSSTPTPSSSSSTFYCSYSNITSPNPREFEFQMFSSSKSLDNKENTTTTSPADELFYKGKLLPLHLPPRLQMVEKLLKNSKSFDEEANSLITPLTTTQNTPFTSCNISPTDSCQVSRELNPDEYFFEDFSTLSSTEAIKMKSWMKKLKKYSSLGLKFKSYSRAYLKALFTYKSGCSDESLSCNAQTTAKVIGNETVAKAKECLNKCVKAGKKNNPFGLIQKQRIVVNGDGMEKEKMIEENSSHRRSFSGAIKRCTNPTTSSNNTSSSSSSGSGSSNSSSFSSNNGYYEVQLLKGSNSANSEIESSIQGAIAHCKQSHHQQQQQLYRCGTRKSVSEVGLTVSRIADDYQERPQLCRG
ncbi:hypothetical protein MKW98_003784 [Papaver atlanticum]|uniref:Membrane-associated kinase regulator 4 n=1 Tax=Papaver atlanticum TaxID=357466 RepID=A0AAD4T5K8_9MAGN|nr:hypothetical protein MKW98_003784 [Papaver atlanticum]